MLELEYDARITADAEFKVAPFQPADTETAMQVRFPQCLAQDGYSLLNLGLSFDRQGSCFLTKAGRQFNL